MKSVSLFRQAVADPRLALMLALGYSSGLPFLLIFSTQSAWLREAGVSRADIGLMSWCALAFSFKFLWAPFIDRFDIPGLAGWLGRRRAWMLVAQLGVAAGLIGLSFGAPGRTLAWSVAFAFATAFAAATQDVTIDGWRIDAAPPERQGMMTAVYSLGYRLAMICAGAGALYLADWASWRIAYLAMAALTLVGICACLVSPRLDRTPSAVRPTFKTSFVEPLTDLMRRHAGTLVPILALVAIYRLPDFVSGVMANPLYIDLGFTKSDIATVSKLYGVWIGIAGAFAGGWLGAWRAAGPADARRQRRELCWRLRRRRADRLHVVAGLAGLCGDAIRAFVVALRAARQIRRRPVWLHGRSDGLSALLRHDGADRPAGGGAVPDRVEARSRLESGDRRGPTVIASPLRPLAKRAVGGTARSGRLEARRGRASRPQRAVAYGRACEGDPKERRENLARILPPLRHPRPHAGSWERGRRQPDL